MDSRANLHIVQAYCTFSILILSECKNLYSRSEDITFSPQTSIKNRLCYIFTFFTLYTSREVMKKEITQKNIKYLVESPKFSFFQS